MQNLATENTDLVARKDIKNTCRNVAKYNNFVFGGIKANRRGMKGMLAMVQQH